RGYKVTGVQTCALPISRAARAQLHEDRVPGAGGALAMGAPKIRRDDLVKVISGKDKGKTGKVLHVEPKKSRVFVEGLNIQKRHKIGRASCRERVENRGA